MGAGDGFIPAADPASKVAYVFTNIGQLNDAIKDLGVIPLRETGDPYMLQTFEGGYILDGAPINVWLDGVWYEGQQDILKPYWGGSIPAPPAHIQQLPVVPMPSDVAQNYQGYQAAIAAGGLSKTMMIGLGGALLIFLLARGKN